MTVLRTPMTADEQCTFAHHLTYEGDRDGGAGVGRR